MSKTKGELRVRTDFNVVEDDAKKRLVNDIKNKSAELINLVEGLRQGETSPEVHRIISIAQTEFETGCMYGIKAATANL
ncbi:MAG: hypothetical protein COA79_25945 [Planctomycetota bacterium]|nr:MAG: hypothetical protein COA79_25945 [Planctomycetota bacterium]